MSESANLEAVHSALKSVKLLRSTIGDVFKCLADCPSIAPNCNQLSQEDYNNTNTTNNNNQNNSNNSNNNNSKESINNCQQINELQTLLSSVNTRFRELETACTLLSPPSIPVAISLGNSNLLGHDPNYDKTNLYSDMINSYRWSDKMQEYSAFAHTILQQNHLKRTNIPIIYGKGRQQRRLTTSGHNIGPQQIDAFIASLQRVFPELSIEVLRPFGNPTILKVVIPRTLRAVILLRGLLIEWVMIKGFNESFDEENNNSSNFDKRLRRSYDSNAGHLDNDKLDIWSESRYKVFRKVTEHANAAMLHYYSPIHCDVAIKTYLTWLKSYSTLFSAPCRKCNCRLQNAMPPTWRDVRNFEAYHEQCRP